MSTKTPKPYQDIELAEDSVIVYQPRFVGPDGRRVAAIVRLPNGQLHEIEKNYDDATSKFVRDIRLQYTEEEILEFTAREEAILETKRLVDEHFAARRAEIEQDALTFQAKTNAFAIPEVKDFPDKKVIRRLRKARNTLEVAAIVSYILGQSFQTAPEASEAAHGA